MELKDFTTAISVEQTALEVFDAINHPEKWWSNSISGNPHQLNEEWDYHFGDNHITKLKTIELIPGKKVVWLVLENHFKNAKDQSEWVGNKIVFDISKEGDKTKLTFTQMGLVPTYNCYKSCDWAWKGFIQKSLYNLIKNGKGILNWYEEK